MMSSLSEQQWCPSSVQVTVQQARGLRIKGKSGTNDAYAVMQVGKEKFQTSVAEKSVAPVWKEEASFDLPPLLLQHGGGGGGGGGRDTLHVHVLHRALVGPDKLLGQAVINLLQLSEDSTRNKTEWFKLLDKSGKPDKDRGEVLVDIQFMRNNMTASMFDLSAAGKSKSRLGKFKDKVRGKKKESDTMSNVVPSFAQVLTDSEEEGNRDGEVAAVKGEKKKKHKMKSLFSPKSNLQKNISQSMSVLPGKNSSLSGSQSSGLNVDSSEGKKKFKFLKHKRSGSSDSKDSSSGQQKQGAAEQSNVCINGSHVYCEEPPLRTSRIGSNFSLASSGHGSMEDVPESSPPSVDSLRAMRQYSPWTEEEEEEVQSIQEDVGAELRTEEEEKIRMGEERRRKEEEEERVRRQEEELEKLAEEKRRQEEEERRRTEEERVKREEGERIRREEEERRQQEEEERVRREEERERLAGLKRRQEEEERRTEEERVRKEEEGRIRREEEKVEEERRRQEEEERVRREEEEREEKRRLEEQESRQREEERIRMEEERAEEERRRQEEEERARRQEEEGKIAGKRRHEEQERRRREEEEMIRMGEEKAEEERRRQEEEERARRQEEEHKLAEQKIRLEEGRRIEEQKVKKEEEERIRREEERGEEERRRREEEEMMRRQEEEREEKRKLEEEEKKRIEAEEKIRRDEEERIRMEEERRKEEEEERVRRQLAEEKRILEEQERRRIEEEERKQREEEEMIRKEEERRREEEERARKEKEERLVEEKIRQQEQERKRIEEEEKMKREEEERIRREEKVEKERKEEEARKLEKEKLKREAEEQKKKETKLKAAGKKVSVESPAEVTTTNPFDEIPDSPDGPDGSTAKVSSARQRVQPTASSLGSQPVASDENDPTGTQRERRLAPQPPGRDQAEKQSQDGSTRHLAQINKKNKDKDVKTVSVPPQRSVQMIAPLSRSPTDTKNTQSLTQSSATKETNVAKPSKRHAPSRPRSVDEGPSSEHKTAPSSDGNVSCERGPEAKQVPIVYGLNPFDDDEDENATQAADKDDASQTQIKSSKARAPPLPAKKAATSSTLINQNTEGDHVTDDEGVTDNSVTHARDPKSEAVHVQEAPLQESQPAAVQRAAEEAGGKKEVPPVATRRLQPVKPLNPLEQQSVSVVKGEKDNKSAGILQEKTKVNDTGLKGPYSQLTQEELISLVLKQETQLSERDKKISHLEQYIDNLLVRVMEEKPSILMSLNSLKAA
ncbi:trichohyalin isoform X2 [Sebastes umbrosus]|uniref:trichohyalin isoform X2 n=1 Tax=Sebastes umbrosus TaxID=72105 RepID=UPI0018A0611F|nr:trichohyalin isoform X2 [Sebastes umbrosus]